MQSLQEMNPIYRKQPRLLPLQQLQSIYVRLFGIPEIGFQIRSLNFQKLLDKISSITPKMILDAGSGIGVYVFYLAKKTSQGTLRIAILAAKVAKPS